MFFDPVLEFLTRLMGFAPAIILPFIVIGIWALIFYNGNPIFTRVMITLFYLLMGIPLMVLTVLSFFLLAFGLAVGGNEVLATTFYTSLVVGFVALTLIFQFLYISRIIREAEQNEGMPFMQIIKRELSPEYRRKVKQRKIEKQKKAKGFFDEIVTLNAEKRKQEQLEKERLRAVLLRGDDSPTSAKESTDE